MKILGIDTSCDDTAVAVLEIENWKLKILSNIVSSQVKLHAKYGGVYPFLAKREHQKNLPVVFRKALRGPASSTRQGLIDFIGVTVGPGLEPCLWQGINFAKEIARKYKKPLIPVNHIEAHILANFIEGGRTSLNLPAMALVVSGGHTQLILMKDIGKYKLIGETRDDAAGECLDKVARILGLGYPGGPAIAEYARQWKSKIKNQKSKIALPRPMMRQKNYDFSFSGLKTAVLYLYQKSKIKNQKFKQAICAEVQQAVIDVLIHKTIKAARDFRVKSIILGGGVTANEELREQFKVQSLRLKVNFLVPPKSLCTDNAAMVAAAAFFHQKYVKKNIEAQANLRI